MFELYSGMPPRSSQMLDFSGFPGLNGPMGMITQMLIQPFINKLYGSIGMIPGQFQPTQNLSDFHRESTYLRSHQEAMKQASQADQQTYVRMMQNMAQVSGIKFDQKAAEKMAGDVSALGPVLTNMMPNLFDELHGYRGSAQVMSHYLHMGGRYSIDPITGKTGLTGDSAGEISKLFHSRMFGANSNLAEMNGLTAGRAGQLYDEMTKRGLMGGPRSLSSVDRQHMLDNPKLADAERGIDAKRTMDRIKNMSGIVAAMRDIFGDMGKPNAPMSELINGLDALTQGGLATMNPKDLEMTARKIHNIARATGTSVDAVMQLAGMAGTQAEQLGLDRKFGLDAALGGLSFGQAYGNVGGLDIPAWGKRSKNEMAMLDAQLRVRAAESPLAKRFSAILRMSDEMHIGADTEFGRLAEALRKGETSYDSDGKGTKKSIVMSTESYRNMASRDGVSPGIFNDILARDKSNQEYGFKYKVADTVRGLQGDLDLNPIIGDSAVNAIRTANKGLDQSTMAKMADAATKTLRTMDKKTRDDPTGYGRNEALAKAMFDALTPEERTKVGSREDLIPTAVSLYAGFDQRVQTNPRLARFGGARGALDANDPKILQEKARFDAEQEGNAALQSALAGLGRGGPLRRIMSLLDSGNVKDLDKMIAGGFGGIDKKIVEGTLKKMVDELDSLEKEFNKLSPREREKREQILKRIREIIGGDEKSSDLLRSKGLRAVAEGLGSRSAGTARDGASTPKSTPAGEGKAGTDKGRTKSEKVVPRFGGSPNRAKDMPSPSSKTWENKSDEAKVTSLRPERSVNPRTDRVDREKALADAKPTSTKPSKMDIVISGNVEVKNGKIAFTGVTGVGSVPVETA